VAKAEGGLRKEEEWVGTRIKGDSLLFSYFLFFSFQLKILA